jgi:predicted DNA-binding transcriptional regulator YafY
VSVTNTDIRFKVGRSALSRVYYIHTAIKSGNYPNVQHLAKALEVSTRAVQRDLEMMRDFWGAPITYCYRRKGYYYENESYSIPRMRFTEGELAALFLGERLLAQYKGHPYENEIRTVYAKIQALFPESSAVDFDEVERMISFAVEDTRGDEQLLLQNYQTIQAAITAKKSVKADYYSASRDSRGIRLINPYHLRFHGGAWYCIGYCHNRHEIRIFALDRFHGLEWTEEGFEMDEEFSIDEYLGQSLNLERGQEPQQITIVFDRYAARWIKERRWHESQRLREQPDGSVFLHLTVSGLGEVKRWVLGFGFHAEVLSPPELREEIKKETKKMAEKYV